MQWSSAQKCGRYGRGAGRVRVAGMVSRAGYRDRYRYLGPSRRFENHGIMVKLLGTTRSSIIHR